MPVRETAGRGGVAGVVTKVSALSVADAVTRLLAVIAAREMKVFAVVDHCVTPNS
jgi:uncharacterized protein (DUF302 family)